MGVFEDEEEDLDSSITLFDGDESPHTKSIRLVEKIGPTHSDKSCDAPQQSLKSAGVPQFSLTDITVGKLLGAGGFCVVRAAQITAIGEEAHLSAIKMARPPDKDDQARHELANEDMKNEAGILAGLFHPNIIKIKGVSRADEPEICFLVVGRLDYTLGQQMSQWRETSSWRKSTQESQKALQTRLVDVAIGIAHGLEYLHKKGIVHRDIKPENIGFDEFDTPVLFDFGLARQIQPNDDAEFCQNMDRTPYFNDSTVSMMSSALLEDDDSDGFSKSTNTNSSALTDNTGLAGTPR
jgi:serine/threonine protein kinase